jgi:phenylacetate-coenzyme A ligase PaaK-like adenylate-forming protein
MDTRQLLFMAGDPFDHAGTEERFVRSMRENAAYHIAHCPEYAKIAEAQHFSPDMLQSVSDLEKLPVLPTVLFKRHRLYSMPEHRMAVRATSHGTKGVFSRIGLDWGSISAGFWMVLRMAKTRRLLSLRPVNYIILGYKPHRGNEMAVMKTAYGSTFLAPALHRTFALRYKDGGYVPDLEGVLQALLRYDKQKHPVRFMGFPSYTFFLLQMLEQRGIRVTLPKHSLIMLGGGWKQFYRERVEKETLYRLIRERLGVEESHIVEFFGAVEHPILYTDCPAHHFHIPVYSRVIIRDVRTLQPLPHGEMGLVNLLTPMIRAVPVTSVMTDDLGILHDGSECPCGCKAPFLEIIGRVGQRDIKTCAAGAAEYLKGGTP